MTRGIVFVKWGTSIQPILERSIASVQKHHPELPIAIAEGKVEDGLLNRPRMILESPFSTTLHLDSDVILMGRMDYAFEMAEAYGLACCINEHPSLWRFGDDYRYLREFNCGVFCFTDQAHRVMKRWKELSYEDLPTSSFCQGETRVDLLPDDQFIFGKAIADANFNPCVLPREYNFRAGWMLDVCLPIYAWHSYDDPPEQLVQWNNEVNRGERLTTFLRVEREESKK